MEQKTKSVFETLNAIDCSEHTETKGKLTYLSWAWAWQILKEELGKSRESKEIWVAGEKDAAQMLGLSVGWLSKMVQGGKLEGCYARIGEKKLNFNITKIRNVMSNK